MLKYNAVKICSIRWWSVLAENALSCCFTGYRPQKFSFPLDGKSMEYLEFENVLFEKIVELIGYGCLTFYTGMAMGFDIVAAECVLSAAAAMPNYAVRLICAVPFPEQAEKFPCDWKNRYDRIMARADEVIIISGSYYRGCYFDRNRFMVDNSDFVLTWFDGSAGGTKNTLTYANSILRKIINLYTGCNNDRSNGK